MKIGISWPDSGFNGWLPDLRVVSAHLFSEYDLIVFPGGSDVSPKLYGEENRYSSINEHRDKAETEIFKNYFQKDTKFLGICRGHQFLNVMLGGKLVQDLQVDKHIHHSDWHTIKEVNNGKVPSFFNGRVNSTHHQGIIIPGTSQKVTSMHKGIIESTESEKIITIQWHPEYFSSSDIRAINFFTYIQMWAK